MCPEALRVALRVAKHLGTILTSLETVWDNLKKIEKNDMIFWKGHVAIAISKTKLIHAYGPMKKTVIMDIKQTIERIERTAKLKVIGIKRL